MEKNILNEEWFEWSYLNKTLPDLYIDSLSESSKGFEILCSGSSYNEIVKISLNHVPFSYRFVDEHFRISTMAKPNFPIKKGHFFVVKNSHYIVDLINKFGNYVKSLNLIHFLIFEENTIVDIVNSFEPKIELLTNFKPTGKSE